MTAGVQYGLECSDSLAMHDVPRLDMPFKLGNGNDRTIIRGGELPDNWPTFKHASSSSATQKVTRTARTDID
jgi:hypothetical protein